MVTILIWELDYCPPLRVTMLGPLPQHLGSLGTFGEGLRLGWIESTSNFHSACYSHNSILPVEVEGLEWEGESHKDWAPSVPKELWVGFSGLGMRWSTLQCTCVRVRYRQELNLWRGCRDWGGRGSPRDQFWGLTLLLPLLPLEKLWLGLFHSPVIQA